MVVTKFDGSPSHCVQLLKIKSTRFMTDNIDQLINLTLELEGLLMLKRERSEMAPAELDKLIRAKSQQINSMIGEGQADIPKACPCTQPTSEEAVEETIVPSEDVNSHQAVDKVVVEEDVQPAAPDEPVTVEQPAEKAAVDVPVVDLRKGMALNDKFLFRRELFNGNEAEFNDTLKLLAGMESIDDVKDYLFNDLCLDPTSETVQHFIEIVQQGLSR